MKEWKISRGYIITSQQEESSDNKNIIILPFWKWASGFHDHT